MPFRRCITLDEAVTLLEEQDGDELVIIPPTGNGTVTDNEDDIDDDSNISDERSQILPNDVCGEIEVFSNDNDTSQPTSNTELGQNLHNESTENTVPTSSSNEVSITISNRKRSRNLDAKDLQAASTSNQPSTSVEPPANKTTRGANKKKKVEQGPRWRNREGFSMEL